MGLDEQRLNQSVDPVDVEFAGVSMRFGDLLAVDDVDFAVRRGSFHSFLGPSGCGKTTTLRLIAGFEQPSAGKVFIGGDPVVGVPAHRRPVNMVFQHYALFPHLSVGQNIGYGLKQRSPRPGKAEVAKRVSETLELVRLPDFEKRPVWELSGGQQQRVALARALINHPTVLLLDEPLAALDRKLRREMQMELQTLQREVGITFLLVTHDQEEALSMSDTISIMREGRISQTATPTQLYESPVNRYVADFVGESNFFPGELERADQYGIVLRTESGRLLGGPYSPTGGRGADRSYVIAVRPEMIAIQPVPRAGKPEAAEVVLEGRITNRIYLGDQTEFRVLAVDLGEVLVRAAKTSDAVRQGLGPGDRVFISWREEAGLALEND